MSAEHLVEIRASAVHETMQGMTFCSNSRLRSPHFMLVGSGAVCGPEGIIIFFRPARPKCPICSTMAELAHRMTRSINSSLS